MTDKKYKCYGCGEMFYANEGRLRENVDFICKSCRRKERIKSKSNAKKFKYLVKEGHICPICGYSGCPDAFDFHHVFSDDKSFEINSTRSITGYIGEMVKCVLVCANCHREIHFGLHDESELIQHMLTVEYLSSIKAKLEGSFSLFDGQGYIRDRLGRHGKYVYT